ncbi:uncharacterized protein LOC120351365 [Nilaparvata lugens]|uniref:uncharacterized protein LOC120351365 n=1 Tax=Nilaparvata lugens TaxID=108931 RepID=UPI00193D4AB5|nr:uncharacterized protein LOC120351365 [Nilaparvata lugens]
MHEIANCTEMNEEDATLEEFLNFPCMSSTRIINFEDNENSSSDEKDCIKDKDYLPSNSDDSENEVSENELHNIGEEIATNNDTTSILPATGIDRQIMEVNVDASVSEASQTVSDFSNTTIIDGSETSPLPTRKRKRNELKWKSVIKKIKVNTGQSYKTKSNKCVPARAVKGTCSVKCRIKCPSKITADQQIDINKAYWEQGDRDRQHNFIMMYTEKLEQKSKLLKSIRNRSSNIAYYLSTNKVRVCKDFFLKTLDISEKVIRNCYKRVDEASGVLKKSKQGKHTKHCTEEELKEMVRKHISSFPKIEFHYLREKTKREFLDGSLNIREMYRLFIESLKESEASKKVSESMYRYIFNNEFNLSFFMPKKDLCAFCEKFKNADSEDKIKLKEKFEAHEKNKILSRKEKENDVNNSDIDTIVSCFDLQAVLPVPCGEVSVFYYKRKLNCYNFTIFSIEEKQGYCNFWSENIARRGVNEIAIFVYSYLKDYCHKKRVIFYSDNCAGQNKNKSMVALYCFALAHLEIEEITHKFLIVGHTQNEGDTMHSVIEKEKKRILKSGPIYVPAQWCGVIKSAKKSGKPFIVNEPDTTDIKVFKDLSKQCGSNWGTNEEGEKVCWNEIKIIHVKKVNLTNFFIRPNLIKKLIRRSI